MELYSTQEVKSLDLALFSDLNNLKREINSAYVEPAVYMPD